MSLVGIDLVPRKYPFGRFEIGPVAILILCSYSQVITCVLFDDAANLLLGITAEQLIIKTLSEGPDDPYWIYEFLTDALCARHVIFRIKVDDYNLAPTYNPRFTVSKYLGDEINNLASTPFPSTCPFTDVLHDETSEYLARINDDEWDMVHESLWEPRISPT
ncbi:hypothetical protein Hanom_Chr05g00432791 [Helianthus anomalus]